MSNKLRIRNVETTPDNLSMLFVVQKCNPGAPWETIKEFAGTDQGELLTQIFREFPKARFR